VVSRPGYSPLLDVRKAANYLDSLILLYNGSYHFWEDNISLLDASLFDLGKIQGYRQLTDLHLLGIAQRNQGTLVTLDAGIASIVTAVNTPSPALLRLLAP
jgi:predicted nucleic acid-binding protein